jgi:hypothetical protein
MLTHLGLVSFIEILLVVIAVIVGIKFGLKGADLFFTALLIAIVALVIYGLFRLIRLFIINIKH